MSEMRDTHPPSILPVRAGTELRGTVYVKIRKDILEGHVVLVLKGKETTWVEYKQGSKSNSKQEKLTFFETQVELGECASLEAGIHSFPFSVILPDYLPTSTYPSADHLFHGIQCTCTAHLGKKRKASFFQVVAAKKPSGARVQSSIGPKTDSITRRKGSRMPKDPGRIAWGAAVDNNRLGRGQNCMLTVSCQNLSVVDIMEVSFKLIEEYGWSAERRWKTKRKELIGAITRMQLPEHMTKGTDQKEQAGSSFFPDIRSDLDSQQYSSRLHLCPKLYDCAHDSYSGKLITVSHYVEVQLKLPPGYVPIVSQIPVIIADFEQTQEPAWQAVAETEAIEVAAREAAFVVASNDDAPTPFAAAVPVTASGRELPRM